MAYTTWGLRTQPGQPAVPGPSRRARPLVVLIIVVCLPSVGALLGLAAVMLSTNNSYARGIVSQSGGSFALVAFGLLLWLPLGIYIASTDGIPLNGVVGLLMPLVFLWFGGPGVLRASQDILSGPSYAHGLVTARQSRLVVVETVFHTRQHWAYEIVSAGHTWSIARQDYDRLAVGMCVVITYGPRTGYATSAVAC